MPDAAARRSGPCDDDVDLEKGESGESDLPLTSSTQPGEAGAWRRQQAGHDSNLLDGQSGKDVDRSEAAELELEQNRSQSLQDYGRDAWVGSELKLKLKERVRHFTWSWFTMTMATGGIANVLSTGGYLRFLVPLYTRLQALCSLIHIVYAVSLVTSSGCTGSNMATIPAVPYRFNGIYEIGCTIFLLNIFLFIFNVSMIGTRFYLYPSTFKASFLHPTESLFIPAAVISFGTIMINIVQYGVGDRTGLWLEQTMVVMYWLYCALAMLSSCGIYLIMYATSSLRPHWRGCPNRSEFKGDSCA